MSTYGGIMLLTAVEYMYIHILWIFFWDEPFLSRFCEIYLSIKHLEILAKFNLLQKLHLCTQTPVCVTNFGPLGEIGANFSLHLTSRTQFAKINSKKVIAEIQCEKHKKSSLTEVNFLNRSLRKGQILWRNNRKITIKWSFSYNSFC